MASSPAYAGTRTTIAAVSQAFKRRAYTACYTCRSGASLGQNDGRADTCVAFGRSEPGARRAVDYFVYRAAREIGGLAAVLGGINGLVFTAGIGENSVEIRARICESSAWLGIDLDAGQNARHGPRISRTGSRVSAWVIPTNEELMITRHTGMLLGLSSSATQRPGRERTSS